MRSYARSVARQINGHAVWEPGVQVRAGDFGRIEMGCFRRLGSVEDHCGVQVVRRRTADERYFEATDGFADDQIAVTGQLAGGRLQLSGNQGLLVSSGRSHIETLENEAEVFGVIRNTRDWKRHWRVVCQVRIVNDALLLFSEGRNQNLEVSFEENKIASVRGGTLSLQRSPVNGALYVSCARPRWFLGAAPIDPSAAIERCIPSIEGEPDEPDDPED